MTLSPTTDAVETTVSALPPHLLQSDILKLLDGRSLASLSSVSQNWRSICSEETLWKDMSATMWPSLAGESISALDSGYRSLYSDCITSSCPPLKPRRRRRNTAAYPTIEKLISAVDVYCDGQILFSKDFVTDTISDVFLNNPFKLQILSPKEKIPTPLKFDDEAEECIDVAEAGVRVSWILIDPTGKRAFNVTGLRHVEANRHWLNGFIKLHYATVVAVPSGEMAQCSVMVTCGGVHGGDMEVVDVTLQVEDLNLKPLTGSESLLAIGEAMAGRRRLTGGKMEKERYREFVKRRVEKKEREEMIKRNIDIVIIIAIVSIFFAIFAFFRSTS